ncbi:MAG: hypothetical protein GY797_03195 [Deltaproteobacteria bacterium]|nr:hypothetical protein [Deltaproteobacteria bacterium]
MNQEHLLSKFQEVIWREVLHCYDETYAYKLLTLLPDDYENRTPQSVFKNRPNIFDLENAVYQVNQTSSTPLAHETWTKPLHNLRRSKNNPVSVEKLITQLNSVNWVERFIARHTLVHLGGEAIQPLIARLSDQREEWPETIEWLLENIAIETSKELPKEVSHLLCPICVVMCGKNKVKLSWKQSLTFYGCQRCYQSRKFIERADQIVAVLDAEMKQQQKQAGKGKVLRVNWLKRKMLFEFDRVEIIKARDEDVELFAIQVGNDKDRKRKSRYKKMKCIVGTKNELLENTIRILGKMFGQVEWQS